MTYSIWLMPTKRDAKRLNQIIKNLSQKYNAPKFEAHMTILSGISSLNKAKHIIDTNQFYIITVKKLGIGQSDYVWKTVFIRIKKEKSLRNIHQIFAKNLKTKYKFQPHISLIYKNLDSATKRKIIASLNVKKSFSFDKITIIKSSKNTSKWEKQYTVRLNATRHA